MTVETDHDKDSEVQLNPHERNTYKFFAQGLDESFNDMRFMHINKAEMDNNPVGSMAHHLAAAKMYHHIINHSKDMINYHTSRGEWDKKARHEEIIHNANAEMAHHLAQFHFAKANEHAEKGNIAAAITHQIKGEREQKRHLGIVSWMKNRPTVVGQSAIPSDNDADSDNDAGGAAETTGS